MHSQHILTVFDSLLFEFQKLYKQDWDDSKATGYQLNHQYIPLLSGKKGREIISDVSVLTFFSPIYLFRIITSYIVFQKI